MGFSTGRGWAMIGVVYDLILAGPAGRIPALQRAPEDGGKPLTTLEWNNDKIALLWFETTLTRRMHATD
jgi:hypothetical protein